MLAKIKSFFEKKVLNPIKAGNTLVQFIQKSRSQSFEEFTFLSQLPAPEDF